MSSDERRTRARPTILLLMVLLLLGAWVAYAGRSLYRAKGDIDSGLSRLRKISVSTVDVRAGRDRVGTLRAASKDFNRAHARVHTPWLLPARFLPVIGRQLRALEALTGGAATLTRVLAEDVEAAGRIADEPVRRGPDRVRMLRRLSAIAKRTDARLADIDLGPSRALLAPLAKARQEFDSRLGSIREQTGRAVIVTAGLADFLEGPRTYLLLMANNAEMRAGSGMFLSAAVMRAENGEVSLGEVVNTWNVSLPPDALPLEQDLADRWGWLEPNRYWVNLGLSPRFDATAELASKMWVALGHPPVEGVLSVDVPALRSVLAATGSIQVKGQRLDAESIMEEILLRQYLNLRGTFDQQARNERMGVIAAQAVKVLNAGDWNATELAQELRGAIDGRHVLAWSSRPEEQEVWSAAGVNGALTPDSLMVSLINRGGNKLDQFMRIEGDLDVEIGELETEVTVHMRVKNATPAGLTRFVVGPHDLSKVEAGTYEGILTLSIPGSSRDSHFQGVDQLAVAGADGDTRVVGFWIELERGKTRKVEARFRLPNTPRLLRVEPSARIPGIRWKSGKDRWVDAEPRVIGW